MLIFAPEARRAQILERFEDLPHSCLIHAGQTVMFVFDEAPLTAREGEVLWRVMLGEPHEKIAGSFGVSRKTITRTVARIRKKLSQSPEQSPWGLLSCSGESRLADDEIGEERS